MINGWELNHNDVSKYYLDNCLLCSSLDDRLRLADSVVCLLLDNLCIVSCCLSKMLLMFIMFNCWESRVVVGAVEVTRLCILHTCAVWR